MGDFRIEVNATGGHGCQRELKDGADVKDCGNPSCPDCIARRFVKELVEKGSMVRDALLIHWPNQLRRSWTTLLLEDAAGIFRSSH